MNGKMIISLALVSMMIVGAFGMMPMAGAEIVNVDNDREIMIQSSTLDNIPNFGTYPIYVGSQNVAFSIDIENGNGDAEIDDDPINSANLSVNTLLRNEAGVAYTTTTNPVTWTITRDDAAETIFEGWWNAETFTGFEFDVKNTAVPGIYNLTVILDYKNDIGTPLTYTGYILFEIRARADVEDNIGGLLPGDVNRAIEIDVDFDGWMGSWPDQDDYVEDLTISITLQNTGFWWFGESSATITRSSDDTFYNWETWEIPLRLSVSSSMNNGEYDVPYSLTYRTSDGNLVVTETGTIVFHVGNLPMLEVSIATTTMAQGTTQATWDLTFTNVGTVDLVEIYFQLDEVYDFFFYTVADHWEDDQMVSNAMILLGDIAVDDTVDATMEVGINPNIPVGMHKVMFYFEGYYYDPDTTNFEWVEVDWAGAPAYPRINGGALPPDSSSVKGPFVEITVTDTVIDIMVASSVWSTTPTVAGRIMDFPLVLTVANQGYIGYSNVMVQIETNTADSPFLNVVNPTATLSEKAPLGYLGVGNDEDVQVNVNLKPDAELGVYMVPVTITAVNEEMRESIISEVSARITIRGIGPQLEVTTVAPETVKAGKAFTLSVTFTNLGDDAARNIIINSASWFGDQQTTINGNYAEPQPNALPLFIGDLEPGATVTVEIPMMANSDMSNGHVYSMLFAMDYVDSFGYGPSTDTFQVSVKSSGMGGSVLGMLYWTFVLLAIIVAIFLIILAVFYVKKNKKPKVAPEQQYNQPPPPPEQMMQP